MVAKVQSSASLRSLERLFEERFDNLDKRFDDQKERNEGRFNSLSISLTQIERDLKSGYATKDDVVTLHELVNSKVSHESILWIKAVVGGMATLILAGFGAALIKIVFGG